MTYLSLKLNIVIFQPIFPITNVEKRNSHDYMLNLLSSLWDISETWVQETRGFFQLRTSREKGLNEGT